MNNLATVERRTTVNRRVLQFWADHGVLKQMDDTGKGTGAPRLFSNAEVDIANMLRGLAARQAPLPELLAVSNALRVMLGADDRGEGGYCPVRPSVILAARKGHGAWLVIAVSHNSAGNLQAVVEAATNTDKLGKIVADKASADQAPTVIDLTAALAASAKE